MRPVVFSLIIPTYNREQFISKAVQSALDQSYPHFEVLVIDDGSKDNTEAVVRAIGDERVKYFRKENGERGAARNYGIDKATGDYITFVDSDDLLYQNHFAEAISLINTKQSPDIFHLAYEYRNDKGDLLSTKLHEQDLNLQLVKGNVISCIGIFIKKEILQQYKFSEDRRLSGTEDWLLWLRLAARYKFQWSDTVTACMIDHETRSVMNYDEAEMLTRAELLLKYLREDVGFMEKMSKHLPRIEAHMYSYIALHLSLSGKAGKAIQYQRKAVAIDVSELFTRRTLALVKRLMMGAFR